MNMVCLRALGSAPKPRPYKPASRGRHLALADESQGKLEFGALAASSAARWLADYRGQPLVIEDIVKEVFDHVRADGVPLMRFGVNLSDYHPAVIGRAYTWEQDVGMEITDRAYTPKRTDVYLDSPIRIIHDGADG